MVASGVGVDLGHGIVPSVNPNVTSVKQVIVCFRIQLQDIRWPPVNFFHPEQLEVVILLIQAGNWVQPTPAGTTAAIETFLPELEKDVRTPIVDPPASAKDAYPIAGLTFLLLPKQPKDPAKGQVVKDFVQFVITQGQNSAEQLEYAKLPPSLSEQNQKLLGELQGGQQTSQNQSRR